MRMIRKEFEVDKGGRPFLLSTCYCFEGIEAERRDVARDVGNITPVQRRAVVVRIHRLALRTYQGPRYATRFGARL